MNLICAVLKECFLKHKCYQHCVENTLSKKSLFIKTILRKKFGDLFRQTAELKKSSDQLRENKTI